jgi:hypothetical protein
MSLNIRSFLFCLLPVLPITGFAQGEDVILKAMHDELDRSMNELTLPNHDKPFFIQYGVRTQETRTVVASMGALYRSAGAKSRDKSVRVLVGDYEFNDESLDDDITSEPEANEIELPLEDDYYGIRRAFWATTDNVYRSAAKHFARNQATLKDQKKPLSEIPHRRFAPAEAVQLIEPISRTAVDVAQWEELCRSLSERFNELKEVNNSAVAFNFIQGEVYIVNSEGTHIRKPFSLAMFVISVQGRTESGENILEMYAKQASTPDRLPSPDSLKAQVANMVTKIKSAGSIPAWKETYTGPVLFIGPNSGELLMSHILYGREGLTDDNNIPSLRGYQVEAGNKMESKIGRQLFSERMTLKLTPRLRTFNGTELLGAYDVDDEGVVPPDVFVLVEKGVLKNLPNDRTLTSDTQKPTGHASGAGVVQFEFEGSVSIQSLRKQLMELARSEGLDFAVIVRSHGSGRMGPNVAYKVLLKDGKEEIYRGANVEGLSIRTIRKIAGTSTEKSVNNMSGMGGSITSVIAPEGILFEELDITEARIPTFKDEIFVENPLFQTQNK